MAINSLVVSVIVPVYNGEKYIKSCLNNICNQTYRNLEIIVINDGSTDKTQEIINEYDDKRIKSIITKNSGVSNARNIGIKNATGDYLMFVDADDLLKETAIEKLSEIALKNPTIDMIRFNGYIQDESGKYTPIEMPINDYMIVYTKNEQEKIIEILNDPYHSLRCYSPLLFLKNNNITLFNTELSYLEDKLFYLENMLKKGKRILFFKEELYYYNYNNQSKTKNPNLVVKNINDIINAKNEISNVILKFSTNDDIIKESSLSLIIYRLEYFSEQMSYKEFKKALHQILKNNEIKKMIKQNSKQLKLFQQIQYKLIEKKLYYLFYCSCKTKKILKKILKKLGNKMKKTINIKSIILNICMFLILLYPFNSTITNIIYPNNFVCIGSILGSMIIIVLLKGIKKFKKKEIFVLSISLIFAVITVINNYYWKSGSELRVILYLIYLLLPFVIAHNENCIASLCKVIKVFFAEHILATYIGIFFKDFYKNYILSLVCEGRITCVASGNFFHGYIPGITSHFSTNAIYLSISTLFLYAELLSSKKKSTFIFFILSLIALFTTGKRAHLIFTIICCLVLYLYDKSKKKSVSKKIMKLSIVGIVGIFGMLILSKYVPEITNIFSRFESLIESGNILNGRNSLYELAFSLWDKHVIFGNGWGAFSYFYQITLYQVGDVAYIDAHNVFIQLLCEVGIVGFIFVALIMVLSFFNICQQIKKSESLTNENKIFLKFSFLYQLFFLFYCITGNPLYDPQCFVIYFITLGYTSTLKIEDRKDDNEENRNYNIL